MKDYEKAPIYQKAEIIEKISSKIVDIIRNEDEAEVGNDEDYNLDYLVIQTQFIREDSLIIPAKIAGAWNADLYDLKMENAAIIRKSARDLRTHLMGLEIHGFKETEYLDLLRKEIDEFRVLFAEWVKTFDEWNYITDRWGLFNPPGVNYDDKDPDDDLPFNPLDFDDF